MPSWESDKMKTAVLCLAVFSIAFALPIAQPPSANTLRKPEIKQKGSRSADVHQVAEAQEATALAPVAAAPPVVKGSRSTDVLQDAETQEATALAPVAAAPPVVKGSRSADVLQDAEAQEATALAPVAAAPPAVKGSRSADVPQDAEAQQAPAPVAAAPTAVDPFDSDESNDMPHKKGTRSADVRQDAEAQEATALAPVAAAPTAVDSFSSDENNDRLQKDPFLPVANVDSNGEEIHFSDEDAEEFEPEDGVLFDAANDPEFKDVEFSDDNFENELASVDEDTDVLTARVQ